MCIIFFAFQAHPQYKLVVAANRDENFQRPTATAQFWQDEPNLLAGQDLSAHGTWLGVTKTGRFAALTNYRSAPSGEPQDKRSRGWIVRDFLLNDDSPQRYLNTIKEQKEAYRGFNVIVGDLSSLWYFSNREHTVKQLEPGVYGLSNHLLDTPWPKIVRGKSQFQTCLESRDVSEDGLFRLLADDQLADDADLPDTGVGLELEKKLSPIFIRTPDYGTRSSTVLTISRDNDVRFTERVYENSHYLDHNYAFKIDATTD